VKPTERDNRWNALVEQAALGELTPLAASSGSSDERLAAVERYYPAFPSLRGSQKFLALRRPSDLTHLAAVSTTPRGLELQKCRDRLDRFVHTAPMSAQLAREAGVLVVHKLNHGNAAPFFAMAFEAPHGDLVCAAPELATAVIAGLDWPSDCSRPSGASTPPTNAGRAYRRDRGRSRARDTRQLLCPQQLSHLMKHNAATGLHAARCRAPGNSRR